MVILGIDAHKQTHTAVVVDEHGRKLGERTVGTTTADPLDLLVGAARLPVLAANGIAILVCSIVNFWLGHTWAFAGRSMRATHANAEA